MAYLQHNFYFFIICTCRPAKNFLIVSLMNSKCIDIKGDDASSGARVIMYDRKPTISINQLWYEDERGIIRSKLNGYTIEAAGEFIINYTTPSVFMIADRTTLQKMDSSEITLSIRFSFFLSPLRL